MRLLLANGGTRVQKGYFPADDRIQGHSQKPLGEVACRLKSYCLHPLLSSTRLNTVTPQRSPYVYIIRVLKGPNIIWMQSHLGHLDRSCTLYKGDCYTNQPIPYYRST